MTVRAFSVKGWKSSRRWYGWTHWQCAKATVERAKAIHRLRKAGIL